MRKFTFLKTYFSPFKPLKLKFYIGETAIGTPYFLPRVWKKATSVQATEAALKEIKKIKQYNERNSYVDGFEPRKIKPFKDYYDEKIKCEFSSPKKIGFDFVGLGWKTKWTPTDFRFEYSPTWSFVFFGYQIAIIFYAPEQDRYWESWLYYELETDKTKTRKERVEDMRKNLSQTWVTKVNGKATTIDYYTIVLKNKYLK
jgi:hypothetical protein